MLWTDEAMPQLESTIDPTEHSRKNLVTQPNCNSDEEADDERDGLKNIDSDSPDEIDDPPLLDKSAENPDHIEISLPNPDSIVRNDSPMNVPNPRPLSPMVTIIETETALQPTELPRLRSRSAIKPRQRLITEV
ncbi:hypothetical protein DAPPUDRAFT_117332 [Daphnia pulex]|uniref:Uncharacterized protein n=1 Tax=Daphnia pulex TaxID=6669 RepID=E9HSC1_DAPPU|nr:hypothetical protein DAPPUDRAFT_336388 [Daphnia pulex]EFX65362.1 hypothetical protein DAPPUDRAFT_117332 [Daphnia pulex]|eukprot:EFX62822.1 hypothetical protein DAPPUDRAFT_336388 [Daphnia pulex]